MTRLPSRRFVGGGRAGNITRDVRVRLTAGGPVPANGTGRGRAVVGHRRFRYRRHVGRRGPR
ncbi:MAG TPA: hypothetical protein VHO67_18095, partial [Polyangia bacterium]|nr:hypothetical protein [Polyangia bacterium]